MSTLALYLRTHVRELETRLNVFGDDPASVADDALSLLSTLAERLEAAPAGVWADTAKATLSEYDADSTAHSDAYWSGALSECLRGVMGGAR